MHAGGQGIAAGHDLPQTLATLSQGEQIYRDTCESCHNLAGQGHNGLPARQNRPVLNKPVADNEVMAILAGIWPEKGQGMNGFAGSLNDEQIAAD